MQLKALFYYIQKAEPLPEFEEVVLLFRYIYKLFLFAKDAVYVVYCAHCVGSIVASANLVRVFLGQDCAAGLAIGASSHGLGASACASVSPVQLAIGGVAIALTGIATSILAPILLPILKSIW